MRIGHSVRLALALASLAASPLGGQIAQQVGWPVDAPGDWNIYSSGVCDLDLDGSPEVIGMNVGSHRMWSFEGSGALTPDWVVGEDFGLGTGDMLTFGDVDGDGIPEIFYQNNAYVLLIFGRSSTGAELPYSPLIVGECCDYIERFALFDLDGDGAQELIVLDSYSLPRVWVFDGSGNVVPGWPRSLALGTAAAGLAIGDLEFDGEPEIVVSTVHPHFPDNGPHPIYVFDRFGNIRDGWPITVDQGVGSLFNVTLVDLDGDYKCEIVGTGRGVFYAIDDDGTLMGTPLNYLHAGLPPSITDFEGDGIPEVLVPGAGVAVFRPGAPPYGFVGQYGNGDNSGFDGVVSADLTGDGVCEIVARCASPPAIHVLNQNLQLLPGWPQPLLPIESVGRRMVDLADLDLDGDLEIIQAAKFDMNAFDVPRDLGTTGPLRIEWPTYYGNTQRTANYHHSNPPRARFLRGDADGDGEVRFGDAFTSIAVVFEGAPHDCPARIDWNCDDTVDVADIISQLSYNFLGGPPASAPWPNCAMTPVDSTVLACEWQSCP